VKLIARRLGVTEQDVINMNRRLGGDASLNDTVREEGDSAEWQDWLASESPDQETTLAASEEFDNRRRGHWSHYTAKCDQKRQVISATFACSIQTERNQMQSVARKQFSREKIAVFSRMPQSISWRIFPRLNTDHRQFPRARRKKIKSRARRVQSRLRRF
ncbi:MAG: hypothetical protein WAK55_05780, partial [Xanthobacteraceae bacterium]